MKRRKKQKQSWIIQGITSVISTSLLLILLGLVVLFSLTARVVADSIKENLTVTVVLEDGVQTATSTTAVANRPCRSR